LAEHSRARVGVFGATGYAGREAVRLLERHARAAVAFTTGSGGGHLPHEQGVAQEADAYLLSLPHGVAARFAARLAQAHPHAPIVDLSGDLRLPTAAAYEAWYGQPHPEPSLLGTAPYGLTEIYRERIAGARLVSNPGCYATAALLPLAPLVAERLIDPADIVIDAKSGATGAGRTPREDLLFCEVSDDFSAYSPGRVHRHLGEMEAVLEGLAGAPVELTFCPHLLPVKRGILAAIYVRSEAGAKGLETALHRRYAGERFVQIVDGKPPHLSHVAHTNECHIAVKPAARDRVVIFSALDNLVKGAAGQAIQNLNLMLGFPEAEGLA
jgi:N-acetyl-gamma-glutamyl-phosphate reductase